MKLKQYQNKLQGFGITRKVIKRLWRQGIHIGAVITEARNIKAKQDANDEAIKKLEVVAEKIEENETS